MNFSNGFHSTNFLWVGDWGTCLTLPLPLLKLISNTYGSSLPFDSCNKSQYLEKNFKDELHYKLAQFQKVDETFEKVIRIYISQV
jgi:hypothetical protein